VTPILHRIIQSRDLPQFTGLAQTRLDELIAAGTFPKPVKLSSRRVGWLESEIITWQQRKIAERDRANGAASERDDSATTSIGNAPRGAFPISQAPRWKAPSDV
jgi:prophage regulatory protein